MGEIPRIQKLVRVLVAVVMAVSLVPLPAFADPLVAAGGDALQATEAERGADASANAQDASAPASSAQSMPVSIDETGEGTEASPYLISNAADLAEFRDNVNAGDTYSGKLLKMTADIELSGTWTPIGTFSYDVPSAVRPFEGTFDGGGHTISGLLIDDDSAYYQGLFGYADGATIMNLVVRGNVTARSDAGGILGRGKGAVTFENVGNEANVAAEGSNVGGIVGYLIDSDADNRASLKCCYNKGKISGYSASNPIGGLVGDAGPSKAFYATFESCYNAGEVSCEAATGAAYAGGLVGQGGAFANCYSWGSVTSKLGAYTGAFSGANVNLQQISNKSDASYYLDSIGSIAVSAPPNYWPNYTSKTAEEFAASDFCEALNVTGIYAGRWRIGGYIGQACPILAWEHVPGEPVITQQPRTADYTAADTVGALGVEAALPAEAQGTGALSYQWYETSSLTATASDQKIAGATNASFTPALSQGQAGYYYCVVTSTFQDAIAGTTGISQASTASDVARVAWHTGPGAASPTFTTQPQGVTVQQPGTAALSAQATIVAEEGVGALSYRWYSCDDANGTNPRPVKGATSATFANVDTSEAGTFHYFCRATNTFETTLKERADSDVVAVTVLPVSIETADDLKAVAANVNSGTNDYEGITVALANDIDLGSAEWTPIGNAADKPFKGTFDGRGHTVSGLSFNRSEAYNGLFGRIEGSTVRDLVVKGAATVSASQGASRYSGGIAGYAANSTFERCGNAVKITQAGMSFYACVGGIVGCLDEGGRVDGCWNKADLLWTGGYYVGGIVGQAKSTGAQIARCYNTGEIANTQEANYYTGGIVGSFGAAAAKGAPSACVNAGVTRSDAGSYAGAIVGDFGTCSGCYYLESSFCTLNEQAREPSDGATAVSSAQLLGKAPLADGSFLVDALNASAAGTWSDGGVIDQDCPIFAWEVPEGVPVFSQQPQSGLYSLVNAENPPALSVAASTTSGASVSYRWYSNTDASNRGGTAVPGATSATFTPPVGKMGTFYYYCTATCTLDGTTSTRTSDVAAFAVLNAAPEKPVITAQPESQKPVQGADCTLSVAATVGDSGQLLYQWYVCDDSAGTNARAISGATGSSYTADTSTYGVASYYFVEVSDSLDGGIGEAVRSDIVSVSVKAHLTIRSRADMVQFRNDVDNGTSYAGLTVAVEPNASDSNMSKNDDGTYTFKLGSWNPIGSVGASIDGDVSTIVSSSKLFCGTFIGNGNTFDISASGSDYQALFANVYGGTIEGVVVSGSVTASGTCAAGIVAFATEGATVRNCGNKATVASSGSNVGGVVGFSGRIPNLWVSGKGNVIESCYNKGKVTSRSSGTYTGGIAGRSGSTLISDCYNIGEISRTDKNATTKAILGGITGDGGSNGSGLARCYNTGTVSDAAADSYVGSLCGVSGISVDTCFFSTEQEALGNATSGATPRGATQVDEPADIDGKLDKLNSAKADTWYSGSLLSETQESPILAWQLTERTITYRLNGGSWVVEGYPTTYSEKVGVKLPGADSLERAGYAFGGWYENESYTGSPLSEIGVESTGDKTLYAKWLGDLSQASVQGIADSYPFNGNDHTPKAEDITVKLGDADNTVLESTAYQVVPSADNMTEAGDYYVTIAPAVGSAGSDLTGEKRVDFSVEPATVKESMFEEIADQTFKGAGVEVQPSIELADGYELVEGKDYVVAYANNDKVTDSALANIVGIGNYGGMVSRTFKIVKADIAGASVAPIADQTHTGKPLEPELSVVMDGIALVKGVDYVVAYSSNTDIGTGRATIVGHGNYRGYQSVTFSIVEDEGGAIDLASCVVAPITAQPFTGSALKPDIKLTDVRDNPLVAGEDYDVIYVDNTKVGTATAIVVGNGDTCKGTLYVTFEIVGTTFEDTGVSVAAIADQQWTGEALEPELEVTTEDGYELVAGIDYLVRYRDNTDVGSTARVTVVGWGAFKGSLRTTFKVVKADNPLTAKAKKATQTVTYKPKATSTIKAATAFAVSGGAGDVTYKKTSGNKNITVDTSTGAITVAKALAAKSYPITVSVTASGDDNHEPKTIDVPFKVTVNKAANTLKVAAAAKTLSAKAASKKTFTAKQAWKVTNTSKGTLTYKKTSGDKKITIASNGKVTVAKGLKKGKTYTVKVTVTSKQTANYKAKTIKNVQLKVKVS